MSLDVTARALRTEMPRETAMKRTAEIAALLLELIQEDFVVESLPEAAAGGSVILKFQDPESGTDYVLELRKLI